MQQTDGAMTELPHPEKTPKEQGKTSKKKELIQSEWLRSERVETNDMYSVILSESVIYKSNSVFSYVCFS